MPPASDRPGRWTLSRAGIINVTVQRRFALRLAEILSKHIAEQRALFDGIVEGDMGMGCEWNQCLGMLPLVLLR